MKVERIEVIYHPEPDPARTYLYGVEAGTLGLKLTTADNQYGAWNFLPEPHSGVDLLRLLEELAHKVGTGLPEAVLVEGVPSPPGP